MTEKKKPKPRRVQGPPGVEKPPRGGGAPTLLTPETEKKIMNYILAGNFPETAAAAAGVSIGQMRDWMLQGARLRRKLDEGKIKLANLTKHETNLFEFSAKVAESMAQSEARDVLLLAKHAEKDWRAGAWRLERRHKKWAAITRLEGTIGTVNVDGDGDSKGADEARAWVLDRIKRLAAARESGE